MREQALVARAADCNPQEVSNAYWCAQSTPRGSECSSADCAFRQQTARFSGVTSKLQANASCFVLSALLIAADADLLTDVLSSLTLTSWWVQGDCETE